MIKQFIKERKGIKILDYNTTFSNKLFYHKDRTCPDDCSGQGTCDASTGVCTCNTGFTGANCAGKKKILEYDLVV